MLSKHITNAIVIIIICILGFRCGREPVHFNKSIKVDVVYKIDDYYLIGDIKEYDRSCGLFNSCKEQRTNWYVINRTTYDRNNVKIGDKLYIQFVYDTILSSDQHKKVIRLIDGAYYVYIEDIKFEAIKLNK